MSDTPFSFAKSFNCECCKNPWQMAITKSGLNASSNAVKNNKCLREEKGSSFSGINPDNFDVTVSGKDDFYLWSNGGWCEKNPIPDEYPQWNAFMHLRNQNLDRIKSIIDGFVLKNVEKKEILNDDEEKLYLAYTSFMNEEAIETNGITSLLHILNLAKTKALSNPSEVISTFQLNGIKCLFSFHSSPDKKNSQHCIGTLYQSGLGLPDRDYYFDEDKKEKCDKYIEYITELFVLLGIQTANTDNSPFNEYKDRNNCIIAANQVFAFEKELALSQFTRTEMRDPEKTYNIFNVTSLTAFTQPHMTKGEYLTKGHKSSSLQNMNWSNYFTAMGIQDHGHALGSFNVANPEGLKTITKLITSTNFPTYLLFHALDSCANYLPADFVNCKFQFHGKVLQGTNELKVRWKRALDYIESGLGDCLGKIYVTHYFNEHAKNKALKIVTNVKYALKERLTEIEWMSAETKLEAYKKMDNFGLKIGFPDKWINFESMATLTANDALLNYFSFSQFHMKLDIARMNAVVDRVKWEMTPQTINAYYHPSLNEIVFPAAILQPPFFDMNADDAVNYGSMGAVIGHEMTHGFDDQGRKFDSQGNLRDWWSGSDGAEYEKRAQAMINQAEEFELYNVKLKGKLTCGENIADLGGLKLSYRALQKEMALQRMSSEYSTRLPDQQIATTFSSLPSSTTTGSVSIQTESAVGVTSSQPLINGFSPEQRFFLAWSQCWRENCKKERALQLISLDPHGPNQFRANVPLKNMVEFYTAFDVQENDKMFKSLQERVDIW